MVIRWSRHDSARFIGFLAGQIRDPVLRLRFLRRFAPRPRRRRARLIARLALQIIPSVLLATGASFLLTRTMTQSSEPPPVAARAAPDWPQPVRQIEQTAGVETWSNGLRIDTRFPAAGQPRSYEVLRMDDAHAAPRRRSDPAGIVFVRASGDPATLQSAYACNFFIDRGGGVFRIVPESEAANEPAASVWADDAWLYPHLNESFVTIAVEADGSAGDAQVRPGAMLIDMLRSRYAIPVANFVSETTASLPFPELDAAVRLEDQRASKLGLSPAAYRNLLRERAHRH